ncbi:DUF3108 domain-containing protein [Microbacterium sp. KUDC0406]|uniref:DUF3108 domain-containing protein n=1 Tax=Microbacterium sp. KUDC0406 TaxID=2909588 RepID=UPI001F346768|nr:DUF3108 domain-containing protein [Microbacterium sp. KUDC0406]UJP09271.1 DUF3108 domain-containing protein [Microbacterium sp. KUDC0406]
MTASDDHVLGPGLLPTPFTAAQIRDASRSGKEIRMLVEQADGTSSERLNRFHGADDEGATLDQWNADTPAEVSSRRVSWNELQEHAAFPIDSTTSSRETVDLPLGRLECLRYDTTGGQETATFWLSPAHPGMPVRYEFRTDAGTMRTTVLDIRVP